MRLNKYTYFNTNHSLFPEIQRIGEAFVIYDVHFCAADYEAHLGADWDFVFIG